MLFSTERNLCRCQARRIVFAASFRMLPMKRFDPFAIVELSCGAAVEAAALMALIESGANASSLLAGGVEARWPDWGAGSTPPSSWAASPLTNAEHCKTNCIVEHGTSAAIAISRSTWHALAIKVTLSLQRWKPEKRRYPEEVRIHHVPSIVVSVGVGEHGEAKYYKLFEVVTFSQSGVSEC